MTQYLPWVEATNEYTVAHGTLLLGISSGVRVMLVSHGCRMVTWILLLIVLTIASNVEVLLALLFVCVLNRLSLVNKWLESK